MRRNQLYTQISPDASSRLLQEKDFEALNEHGEAEGKEAKPGF